MQSLQCTCHSCLHYSIKKIFKIIFGLRFHLSRPFQIHGDNKRKQTFCCSFVPKQSNQVYYSKTILTENPFDLKYLRRSSFRLFSASTSSTSWFWSHHHHHNHPHPHHQPWNYSWRRSGFDLSLFDGAQPPSAQQSRRSHSSKSTGKIWKRCKSMEKCGKRCLISFPC